MGPPRIGASRLVFIAGPLRPAIPGPRRAVEPKLKAEEVTLLVAHEFGHTLGLLHCLSCDSIMNYLWETERRRFVTELDVRTYKALSQLPNGLRSDMKRIGQP
ncbi:MAG TPA: matrixin family metalloprotease [Myxococcota bacterium]|nr:matrixin family metalloprotease [Myxococcota bacterium]